MARRNTRKRRSDEIKPQGDAVYIPADRWIEAEVLVEEWRADAQQNPDDRWVVGVATGFEILWSTLQGRSPRLDLGRDKKSGDGKTE